MHRELHWSQNFTPNCQASLNSVVRINFWCSKSMKSSPSFLCQKSKLVGMHHFRKICRKDMGWEEDPKTRHIHHVSKYCTSFILQKWAEQSQPFHFMWHCTRCYRIVRVFHWSDGNHIIEFTTKFRWIHEIVLCLGDQIYWYTDIKEHETLNGWFPSLDSTEIIHRTNNSRNLVVDANWL